MGQGVVLTLSLVVFRERFGEGVGSFSNLIGAGGIGVLLGILTVGALEDRFSKERIVAGAFLVGGLAVFAVSFAITGSTVLLASFAVGLTFAWKKIPIDTMVQEALPDGYRGRVFAAYDVAYNLARIIAAGLAIPMLPHLGVNGSVAAVGIVFLLWAPVLPDGSGGRRRSSSASPRARRPRNGPAPWCGAVWRSRSRSCVPGTRSATGCGCAGSAWRCRTARSWT